MFAMEDQVLVVVLLIYYYIGCFLSFSLWAFVRVPCNQSGLAIEAFYFCRLHKVKDATHKLFMSLLRHNICQKSLQFKLKFRFVKSINYAIKMESNKIGGIGILIGIFLYVINLNAKIKPMTGVNFQDENKHMHATFKPMFEVTCGCVNNCMPMTLSTMSKPGSKTNRATTRNSIQRIFPTWLWRK